MSAVVSYVRGQ